jgi:methylenetetrahydrofolate reductase (NADPH)
MTPVPPQAETRLERTLRGGAFAVTAELTPPVAGAAAPLLTLAAPLRDRVDAVNVTDGPRGRVRMSSLAAAAILAADGVEPVLQLTCRDRNRIALQSDLLGASALDIGNVLVLRGDDPGPGEGGEPAAKPVFDIDSEEVIAIAARMQRDGVLPSGRAISAPPRLFVGTADTPVEPQPGWAPTRLAHKVELGARFVQTQLCYDIGLARRYMARLVDAGIAERAFVLIGTGPIASARSARWMRDNLWGVSVPETVIARLESAADPVAEGIAICVEIVAALRDTPGVAGVHLMAPGNLRSLPPVLDKLRPPAAIGRT